MAQRGRPKGSTVRNNNSSEFDFSAMNKPVSGAKQVGTNLNPFNASLVQSYYRLPTNAIQSYIYAATVEPTIHGALELIIRSLVGAIGSYEHPNKEIQDFVRQNLLELDESLSNIFYNLTYNNLTAGYAVGENIWALKNEQWWLKNVACYHPASIFFSVNHRGILTEGEASLFGPYTTGVWQHQFMGTPMRLPRNKLIITAHKKRDNNYYGESAIKPIYNHYLAKGQVLPMQLVALDRYGSPLIHANVPAMPTTRMLEDPITKEIRPMSMAEDLTEKVSNLQTGSTIVTEQPPGANIQPIKIEAITTSNNFGKSFDNATQQYNREIYRGLLVPQLLLETQTGVIGQGGAPIHFEVFKIMLQSLYEEVMGPFLRETIGSLVWYNFNERNPGSFPFMHKDIATQERIAALLKQAVVDGFLDYNNIQDLDYGRRLLGLPQSNTDELASHAKQVRDRTSSKPEEIKTAGQVLKQGLAAQDFTPEQIQAIYHWLEEALDLNKEEEE